MSIQRKSEFYSIRAEFGRRLVLDFAANMPVEPGHYVYLTERDTTESLSTTLIPLDSIPAEEQMEILMGLSEKFTYIKILKYVKLES